MANSCRLVCTELLVPHRQNDCSGSSVNEGRGNRRSNRQKVCPPLLTSMWTLTYLCGLTFFSSRLMTIVSSEGSTVVKERRLLQNTLLQPKASGPTDLAAALATIQQNPIHSQMPSISFNVDVPQTLSKIYGIEKEPWMWVNIKLTVKSPLTDVQEVRSAVAIILKDNTYRVCPQCKQTFGVFQDVQPIGGVFTDARRQLKQDTATPSDFVAAFSFLATYTGNNVTEYGYLQDMLNKVFLETQNSRIAITSSSIITNNNGVQATPAPATPAPATPAPATPAPATPAPAPAPTPQPADNNNDLTAGTIVLIIVGALLVLIVCMGLCIPLVMSYYPPNSSQHRGMYDHLPPPYAPPTAPEGFRSQWSSSSSYKNPRVDFKVDKFF
jgi:hypothetical protein